MTDTAGLLWLANMNCITPHVWTARDPDLLHPDLLVFDLDPSANDADALRAATLLVRDALAELGLTSRVKTTGSKGFHVVVPLDRSADYSECARFAHGMESRIRAVGDLWRDLHDQPHALAPAAARLQRG